MCIANRQLTQECVLPTLFPPWHLFQKWHLFISSNPPTYHLQNDFVFLSFHVFWGGGAFSVNKLQATSKSILRKIFLKSHTDSAFSVYVYHAHQSDLCWIEGLLCVALRTRMSDGQSFIVLRTTSEVIDDLFRSSYELMGQIGNAHSQVSTTKGTTHVHYSRELTDGLPCGT